MTNNSLSIYVESANIFYQDFNTNENVYSFLLVQQDETKSIVPKRLSHSYSFEKYIQSYLSSFSRDDVEKYNLYSNKNAKYLFYKLNDWMESMKKTSYSLHRKKKDDFSLKTTGKKRKVVFN